ncbi:MAG: hypothetical protein DMG35_14020 [Acidobacteria bacterium]|nr:MAG: hypothetical protein AUH86_00505 [Acidobacteria bacterium 13_1_40CM_4_58_4]PYT59583.1 MAG: hypothetical protein DMG35_14020 [Acidobacteriota bacterium]
MGGPPSTPLDYPDELLEASGRRVVRSKGQKIGCLKRDTMDGCEENRISAKSMENTESTEQKGQQKFENGATYSGTRLKGAGSRLR